MKKLLIVFSIILLAIILFGIYKFDYLVDKNGYTVDGNKIISGPEVVCDENFVRYENEAEAQAAGLKPAQYGATYCPEYKMHLSWDENGDGINDCYESNNCDKNADYASPRE